VGFSLGIIKNYQSVLFSFDLPLGRMDWTNEGSAADKMKCNSHTVVDGRFEVCRIGQGRFVAIRM
jgi:hypothetical protein